MILERLLNKLFSEKEIPVEVMPETFSKPCLTDTEEIEFQQRLLEEKRFMDEYIFNNLDNSNNITSVVLDDEDYIGIIPSEIGV